MRSWGSHVSHKHWQEARGKWFNEELDVVSRKSHNSRVSKWSQAISQAKPQPNVTQVH